MLALGMCLMATVITGCGTPGAEPAQPPKVDPVEQEYQRIMAEDDKAQAEVDEWIRGNKAFTEKGGGLSDGAMRERIQSRFAVVRKGYEDFLKAHPEHAAAHIAYGNFLNDIHEEDAAIPHWELAVKLDPKNPGGYNQLANHYGHDGPVKKAFEYYEKAIQLDPTESVYYNNMATTVYLFRRDAKDYYKLDEQQVFDKALELYAKAVQYDPTNFTVAQDLAQTYYGIKPYRLQDALVAWTNTLKVASTDIEREGVYLHLARWKLHAEKFDEARAQLKRVTLPMYDELKSRLTKNIDQQEAEAKTKGASPSASVPAADKPPAVPPPDKPSGKQPQP